MTGKLTNGVWSAVTETTYKEAYEEGYKAGAADERKACLEVLQDFGAWGCDPNETSKAIRARGEKK